MAYSSTFSTLATPNPTDRLNNPSHSQLHQNENAAILEIERTVGLDSSILGTVIGDLRNPLSNGGGHIQTAVTGGTGQITYNKGDLLVAQGSSVLTKLAVGADNLVLQTDSSQAVGVKWGAVIANKIAVTSSSIVAKTSIITSLFSTTIPGSTLGTNNAIRFTAAIGNLTLNTNNGINFVVNYGNNKILDFGGDAGGNGLTNASGTIQGMIVGNGSVASQKAIGNITIAEGGAEQSGDANIKISKYMSGAYGTSSVASGANQTLTITAQMIDGTLPGSVIGQFLVIEKIV